MLRGVTELSQKGKNKYEYFHLWRALLLGGRRSSKRRHADLANRLTRSTSAGLHALELGPYGYFPLDVDVTSAALERNGISVVAGTVFNNLVDPQNRPKLVQIADDICSLITKLPPLPTHKEQHFPTPYLVIIEWGHDERDFSAGHPDQAPRLNGSQWNDMVESILACAM